MKLATLILLCTATLVPTVATAQLVDDHLRVGGYLALGLGGEATASSGSLSSSDGLDPTVGFGLRMEGGVWDYVSIGANIELLTMQTDAAGAERETVFDADLWIRARYLIEISRDELYLEPYIGMPFGLSIGVLQDIDGSGDDAWPGWNIGVLGGAYLLTNAGIGFFVEGGWRYHQLFTSGRVLGFDVDAELSTHQFATQIGVVLITG